MVLLGGLPLVSCTEKIESVSMSGYNRVSESESRSLLSRYRSRPVGLSHLSLHRYFFWDKMKQKKEEKKKQCVPHYVGSSTTPKYPPTESYARAMLIIHKPWRGSSRGAAGSKILEFTEFIKNPICPKSLTLAYARAKERHDSGRKFSEPTAQEEDSGGTYGVNGIDDEAVELMEFITSYNLRRDPMDGSPQASMNRGLNYDWGTRTNKVRNQRHHQRHSLPCSRN